LVWFTCWHSFRLGHCGQDVASTRIVPRRTKARWYLFMIPSSHTPVLLATAPLARKGVDYRCATETKDVRSCLVLFSTPCRAAYMLTKGEISWFLGDKGPDITPWIGWRSPSIGGMARRPRGCWNSCSRPHKSQANKITGGLWV